MTLQGIVATWRGLETTEGVASTVAGPDVGAAADSRVSDSQSADSGSADSRSVDSRVRDSQSADSGVDRVRQSGVRLEIESLSADCDGSALSAPPEAGRLGPLRVHVDERESAGDRLLVWAVENRSSRPVKVRSVSVAMGASVAGPVRMWRHGYQSWSPSGMAVVGRAEDPSAAGGAEMLRAAHHSDQRVAPPGELRSEWVTQLADGSGQAVLLGFIGSGTHDGCFRATARPGGVAVEAQAFLDVEMAGGEQLRLDPVVIGADSDDRAESLLARWADRVGQAASARVEAPYQVGWCSWYHYFAQLTEADIGHNLSLASDWPFEVFQVDDGFQATVGDWLETNERFPRGIAALAEDIRATGQRAGLWLAPFLVAPDSRVATRHPEWLARWGEDGRPLIVWFNPAWGGGRGGLMYCLDTTRSDVLAHLEDVSRHLMQAGFDYLKLDFTFAPSAEGQWHRSDLTPAQRVRAGFDAIRRGAGEEAFLLACGAPLSHVVGVVDAVRIGQDVAPLWSLDASEEMVPGYLWTQPATLFAASSTLGRAFAHRRLWLNDPDCLMLRRTQTRLSVDAARTWARLVGLSGGMALVSDDLSLLGPTERTLLDEVLELGDRSDRDARAGHTPSVPGRLTEAVPSAIEACGRRLDLDPATGRSQLVNSH